MARKDIMIDIENGGFIVGNKNQQKETFPIIYIQKEKRVCWKETCTLR